LKIFKPDSLLAFIILSAILLSAGCSNEKTGIAAFLENIYTLDQPGAAVLVKQESQPSELFAAGLAELDKNTAIDPEMVFPIASITKSFTAVSVMILKEQGKLNLTDSFTRYFPEYSLGYDQVNIGHLLSHTSGVFSYNLLPEYQSHPGKAALTLEEMMDFSRNKPLRFPPGTQFNYSNTNYIFLTSIIEKTSGRSFQEFVTEEILVKSRMDATFFDTTSIKGSSPQGYKYSDNSITVSSEDTGHTFGAGMMHSTVTDISRFLQALESNTLITRKSRDLLFSVPLEHKDGRPDEYAHGFWMTEIDGTRAVKMEGYCNGFFTNALYLPDTGIQIIIFTNNSGFPRPDDPVYIARWLNRYLQGVPVRIHRKTELAPEILEGYEGVYRIDADNTREVSVRDGRLFTLRTGGSMLEAIPDGENSFFYPNTFTTFTFTKDEAGQLSGMNMTDDGGKTHDAILTSEPAREAIALAEEVLVKFTGKYDFGYSVYEIRIAEGALMLNDGRREYELFPETENSFFPWHEDAHWIFHSNEKGEINSLTFRKGGYERTVKKLE